ncbi:MAG TPA: DUF1015 family protein [Methanocorpusculum sp.]|nr:DUF1015 family protein [Methanocorpusculum sp.]
MVTIYPFKGLHPSPEAFSVVPSVPYDVIGREEAAVEIAENPKSFLRVIRPDAELADIDPYNDRIYERAKEMFAKFKANGLLEEDAKDAYYLYRITLSGEVFTGLISCVSVQEYNDDIIKKHELTRYDKEEDRTKHIDSVSAHTGQVFLLYKDLSGIQETLCMMAESLKPFGEYMAKNGTLHQIYRVDNPENIAEITSLLSTISNLYIADGHHRAKSSVNVCERRTAEKRLTPDAEKFMSVLFAHESVRIYGYHRLIRDLAGMNADTFLGNLSLRFNITPIKKVDVKKNTIPPCETALDMHIIHLYLESQWYELTRKMDDTADAIERLDVSVLQNLVLDDMLAIVDPRGDPRISFVGGIVPLGDVIKKVDNGEYSAAFIMQPVTAQQVIDVADAGLIMPPKSTWFEPKLLSGMVIHEIK